MALHEDDCATQPMTPEEGKQHKKFSGINIVTCERDMYVSKTSTQILIAKALGLQRSIQLSLF